MRTEEPLTISAGLWCITTFFNFSRSAARLGNYHRFRESLGLPLLTVELSLDAAFELASNDADILHQVSDASLMWQKERLLNMALRRLPSQCNYVAWIDADVRFLDPDWSTLAVDALSECEVIQPFRVVRHLDPTSRANSGEGKVMFSQPSVGADLRRGESIEAIINGVTRRDSASSAPGFAWIAHRPWLEVNGFYDYCIVGGGDTAWLGAITGSADSVKELHRMNAAQRDCYQAWAKNVATQGEARIGVLNTEIEHLWHGSIASRRTQQRHDDLAAFGFEPQKDLVMGAEGAWRWARNNPGLHVYLRDYVSHRESQES